MVLETVSISHGKASAYLPVIDLLRNYFRIANEEDERTRREKVGGRITILDRGLEGTLPYLFSLLGVVEGDDPLAQMDGQIKKRRTLEAIKRIVLRESLNQPLMLIFEDLHWIDEHTQEFLNVLADSIGTAKILLLVSYRPEYSHQWNSKTYYTQLRLDPLGPESAEEMLSALLTSPAPATQLQGASRERSGGDIGVAEGVRAQNELAALKRLIIERTEGTPFFMEEIVRALFEDGVLQRDSPHPDPSPDTLSWRDDTPPSPAKQAGEGSKEGSYREGDGSKGGEQRIGAVKLTRSMNAVTVPGTVQAVLASRIDRLAAGEKELLQTLAVLGREFPLGLVCRVWRHLHPRSTSHAEQQASAAPLALSLSHPHLASPATQRERDKQEASGGQSELERRLAQLQAGEFISEQPATGDIGYIFKHALTQEVAYNTLLVERRKLLHERAGLALESMFAEQLEDHLDELAYHYNRSDNVAKAVEYLGRAGEQALQRSAYADAISGLSAALNLLQRLPDSPERIQRELRLQLAIGPALSAVKGWAAPEVERAYTRARELCERVGNPPELLPALVGLWGMHWVRGELRRADELATQLLRLAQSSHDPALLLYARYVLGNTSFWRGELLCAKEHLELAISIMTLSAMCDSPSAISGLMPE